MKELNFKNILVPVDFSKMSIRAVEVAKDFAQRFGSEVHLVTVQEPIYPAMFFFGGGPVPITTFDASEDLRKAGLERLRCLAKEHGLAGRCAAVLGAPVFDQICAVARELRADLLVTSTHGRTGLPHVVLGSIAERLVQHASVPVLVLRDKKVARPAKRRSCVTIDQILVPVDFSDCALGGLNYAIGLAKKFAAKIVVLHVLDFGQAITADSYGMYDLSNIRDMAFLNAEEDLRKFLRRARFGSVPFKSMVVVGPAVNVIQTAATNLGVDLIVTATHGRTGLKHVLIGSTAELVVRHAPCPVLVVPSHPQERGKPSVSRAKRNRGAASPRPRTASIKSIRNGSKSGQNGPNRLAHPFPERRKTNKFRETHLVGLR